ncbi:MAG TPA: isoprenylcysteine carboxylmethyltransferase family protein [Thermoanaerobaculia bacterium]
MRHDVWLYAFHVLFYLTFLPRVLERRRSEAPAAAEGAAPPARARFARGVLLFHMVGFFFLYFGINASIFDFRAVRPQPLFPPQRLAAAIVLLAASGLSLWALAYFRSWRVRAELAADHELATGGPFRFVRHPIYLAMALLALGSFLWLPRPLVAFGALLVMAGCDVRARTEEKLLVATFGDRYREYMARVKRFVPGIY